VIKNESGMMKITGVARVFDAGCALFRPQIVTFFSSVYSLYKIPPEPPN